MVQFVSQDHFSFLISCHNKFPFENYAYVVFCLNLTLIAVIQTSFHSVVYCVQSFREGKRQGAAEETSPCPLCLWAYSSQFTRTLLKLHYSNSSTNCYHNNNGQDIWGKNIGNKYNAIYWYPVYLTCCIHVYKYIYIYMYYIYTVDIFFSLWD